MAMDFPAGRVEQGQTGTLTSADLPPAARLQILTTEQWSLLSTRALNWNGAFSRASMFLFALSGGVIALALVAEATSFDDGFAVFALLLLGPILFLGDVRRDMNEATLANRLRLSGAARLAVA